MSIKSVLGTLFFCLGMVNCGPTEESSAVALKGLKFLGAGQQSSEVMIFAVDFVDEDGNLGSGAIDIQLNGKSLTDGGTPILPLFLVNGLDPASKSGTLVFHVEFFHLAPIGRGKALLELAVSVVDQDGNWSNVEKKYINIVPGS